MWRQVDGRTRGWRVGIAAAVLPAVLVTPALSQSSPPGGADGAPSEAARRAAMSPFRMILQNADAARKPVPPPPPKKAAPAPAPTAAPVAAPQAAVAPPPAPVEPPKVEEATAAASSAAPAPAPAPVELVALKQDPPMLSATLRREQPHGIVKVGFAVKPDGTTGDVHIVSSTNRKLNTASVDAVTGWRFKPIGETRPIEVELVFEPGNND